MRLEKTIPTRTFLAAMSALLFVFATSPSPLQGQAAAGNNTVYSGTSATVTPSTAYIDATAWADSSLLPEICDVINSALHAIPSGSAAVIDARGLSSNNATMHCTLTKTPWLSNYTITAPSTILLPSATGGASPEITINAKWVLPDRTKIIGLGRTNTSLQVSSTFALNTPMIQMGSAALCPNGCTDIGISDLRLDGCPVTPCNAPAKALAVNGIVNKNAGAGSYVSHVTFHYIEGTGLDIETSGANDSGPYVDITPGGGGSSCVSSGVCSNQSSATTCIKIINAQTRGIHGFTCTAGYLTSSGGPSAGIYLDGNNNTIEDGHFEGVKDGIVVGDQQPAAGNVILNITGASGGASSGDIANIVHICNPATLNPNQTAPCTHFTGSVTDLSLSAIQTYTGCCAAILDEETSTTLTANGSGQPYYVGAGAGLYVLGEPTSGGYSRFNTFWYPLSTSIKVPSWFVPNNTMTLPSGSCPVGSIFSNGGGSTQTTLYVCVGGSGGPAWANLK